MSLYIDNAKMDKVVLRNKYLECANLLAKQTLPDNLPDILHEMINNTKSFADKLKSDERKGKSTSERKRKRCLPNTSVKGGSIEIKNRSAKTSESSGLKATSYRSTVEMTSYNVRVLKPRVYLTRLIVQNEDGIQQEPHKRPKLEISEMENVETPPHVLKKLREVGSTNADQHVNLFDRGLSDGCIIS